MALEDELTTIQGQLDRMNELLDEMLTTMRPLTEWFRILSSPSEHGDTGRRAGLAEGTDAPTP